MADALAIYAAVVGSVALAWQIWSQIHAERTALELHVGGGWDGAFFEPEDHVLYATVVNHSRHDLPMPGLDIFQASIGRWWPIVQADTREDLPETIMARGSVTACVPISRFEGIDLRRPVVASAITHQGKRFSSRPTVIAHVLEQLPEGGDHGPSSRHP